MLFDCLHQKAAVEIIAVELSRQYDQGHIGTRLDGFLLDGFFKKFTDAGINLFITENCCCQYFFSGSVISFGLDESLEAVIGKGGFGVGHDEQSFGGAVKAEGKK